MIQPWPETRWSNAFPIVDPRSGTAKVTIAIPDTSNLRPGAFLSVELVTAKDSKAVLLPRKALVYDNEQAYALNRRQESGANPGAPHPLGSRLCASSRLRRR